MRIEIDNELAKLLDNIKTKEPVIYGRGHVETVRFLANYYRRHRPLQELLNDVNASIVKFLSGLNINIEAALEKVILKAIARAVVGILKIADENKPQRDLDVGSQDPRKGRLVSMESARSHSRPGSQETFKGRKRAGRLHS